MTKTQKLLLLSACGAFIIFWGVSVSGGIFLAMTLAIFSTPVLFAIFFATKIKKNLIINIPLIEAGISMLLSLIFFIPDSCHGGEWCGPGAAIILGALLFGVHFIIGIIIGIVFYFVKNRNSEDNIKSNKKEK